MTSFKSHNNGRKYIMIISVVVVLGRKTQILENAFIYFAFYSQKESQNAVEFESYKTYNADPYISRIMNNISFIRMVFDS